MTSLPETVIPFQALMTRVFSALSVVAISLVSVTYLRSFSSLKPAVTPFSVAGRTLIFEPSPSVLAKRKSFGVSSIAVTLPSGLRMTESRLR